MQESPHDFLTRAAGYVAGFVGLGGLLGYLQYRLAARRAPVDIRLAAAQAEVHQATAEEIRAKVRREDEDAIVGNLRTVAQELRADVERLRDERDAADVRVGQLLIERRERDEAIERLREQLRLAEEELGLKSRSDRAKG